MIGYSDATTITGIIASFFVILALIALIRYVFTREQQPSSRSVRVGVFIERDQNLPAPDVEDDVVEVEEKHYG